MCRASPSLVPLFSSSTVSPLHALGPFPGSSATPAQEATCSWRAGPLSPSRDLMSACWLGTRVWHSYISQRWSPHVWNHLTVPHSCTPGPHSALCRHTHTHCQHRRDQWLARVRPHFQVKSNSWVSNLFGNGQHACPTGKEQIQLLSLI